MPPLLLNRIVGQELAKKIIGQTLAKKGEIYNFLFFGPDGVGKRRTALLLAKSLLCPEGGCEICPVCQKFDFFTIPDFKLIVPIPPRYDDSDAESAGKIYEYTRDFINLNTSPRLEDRSTIRIGQIRNLQSQLLFRPIGSKRRVIVILDADRMSQPSANCFLKTLEEPPPGTIFILTTARLYSVLPTIRSRCQLVPFRYLTSAEIKEIFETFTLEESPAGFQDFGLGSINDTLLINTSQHLGPALEVFRKSPLPIATIIKYVEDYANKPLVEFIYSLLILYRASIFAKLSHPPDNKYLEIIKAKIAKCDLKKLYLSTERLHSALTELSGNPNKKLFLFSILTSLK